MTVIYVDKYRQTHSWAMSSIGGRAFRDFETNRERFLADAKRINQSESKGQTDFMNHPTHLVYVTHKVSFSHFISL